MKKWEEKRWIFNVSLLQFSVFAISISNFNSDFSPSNQPTPLIWHITEERTLEEERHWGIAIWRRRNDSKAQSLWDFFQSWQPTPLRSCEFWWNLYQIWNHGKPRTKMTKKRLPKHRLGVIIGYHSQNGIYLDRLTCNNTRITDPIQNPTLVWRFFEFHKFILCWRFDLLHLLLRQGFHSTLKEWIQMKNREGISMIWKSVSGLLSQFSSLIPNFVASFSLIWNWVSVLPAKYCVCNFTLILLV